MNSRDEVMNMSSIDKCDVCDKQTTELYLSRSIREQDGKYEYQHACSTCIEMFNLHTICKL